MTSLPLAMLLFLVGGILFGLTVCNLTCGPLLAVRLGNRARGWKDGAYLATIYSIPRIAMLIIFGAIVGGAGGFAADLLDRGIVTAVQAFAYLAIGALMMFTGFHHARGVASCEGNGLFDRLVRFIGPHRGRSERLHMTLLGALFSLACLGEAWFVLTASTFGSSLEGGSPLEGAIFGMAGMFSFSAGLSIPAIALSALSSEVGRRYDLRNLLRSGGYLLVGLGVLIILFESFALYGLIT